MDRDIRRLTRVQRGLSAVWLACWLGGCTAGQPGGEGEPPAKPLKVVEVEVEGTPMVLVPDGRFMMGRDGGHPSEAPQHPVQISGFAIDKFEVRQQRMADLELPNPSKFKDPDRPVDQVRWTEAARFCNERSRAEGLEPCYDETTFVCNFAAGGYRLPTEAEWEYAARCGGDASLAAADLRRAACFAENSDERTDRVGQRRPNAWGLHDMLGNVAEWSNDVFSDTYGSAELQSDPRGPSEGKLRVIRGGSWKSPAEDVTPFRRLGDIPGIVDACIAKSTYGFRCVRRLTAAERQAHPTLEASGENRLGQTAETRPSRPGAAAASAAP